ncbi:Gfo/Idh/MocA family oxidoreductase [Kribbella sp. NPDC000426]|uniref:Gfo/Idh/MocA family protein n=1 Tax=Kribbella sp. NPDC000426 TaxID=3154255 RepID=UPI00331D61E7
MDRRSGTTLSSKKEALMNIESLRTAVVGCGGHGTNLAQAVRRSDHLQLVACADIDVGAARNAAALTDGASAHGSVEELLGIADVDAVLIATPHDALAPAALAAIRAGKHVMIEKPMALNEEQAKEVEFAAASAGVTCMVGYSFRYGMAAYLSKLLGEGAVGDIQAITGSIGTPPMTDDWVAQVRRGGGPMLYVGCHLMDLALWFVGEEPTEVSADVSYRGGDGVDESSAVTLGFSGGRPAQFVVTQQASGFFYDLRIIGSAGFVGLCGRTFGQFEIDVQSEVLAAYKEPATLRPRLWGDHITTMLMPELAEFAAAVAEERPAAVTATDGRRVLRVIDAVALSARTRQPVGLTPTLSAY